MGDLVPVERGEPLGVGRLLARPAAQAHAVDGVAADAHERAADPSARAGSSTLHPAATTGP